MQNFPEVLKKFLSIINQIETNMIGTNLENLLQVSRVEGGK